MTPLAVGLEEASGLLGISARTLRKMASDGRVPSVKLGRRLLFRVQDLEIVLAQAVRQGESQLKVVGGRNE
jgi:excisionase family DNA binding protein